MTLTCNSVFFRKIVFLIFIAQSLLPLPTFSKDKSLSSLFEKPFLSSIPALFVAPSKEYAPTVDHFTLHPERPSFLIPFKLNKFQYTYQLQENLEAPVLVIIPGMGGVSTNQSTLFLSEIAFKAGYSVITMTSSTHWSFALAISSSGRTGHLPDDSKDMYLALKTIKSKLESQFQIRPSKWGLMGTSYGGLDGSFLMMQDLQQKLFQFDFIVLMNTPLNRTLAISKIDSFYSTGQHWSPGQKKYMELKFLHRASLVRKHNLPLKTVENLEMAFLMEETEISWLLSDSFREVVLNSAFIGNRLENRETISPEDAFHGNILNYLREDLYKKNHHAQSIDDLKNLERQSNFTYALSKNNFEILNTKKIILFHSTNDYLSFPEGNYALNELSPKIEKYIYPFGGHLGILNNEFVIKDLYSVLIKQRN